MHACTYAHSKPFPHIRFLQCVCGVISYRLWYTVNLSPRNNNDKSRWWCKAEEELVVKRGATSTIWNWFGYRKSDVEQTTVIGMVCRKTVGTNSGNTSNLFHHLKHKPEYKESLKIHEATEAPTTSGPRGKKIHTQTKIASTFANCVPYDKQSKRWNKLKEAVAFCLAKDMLPI